MNWNERYANEQHLVVPEHKCTKCGTSSGVGQGPCSHRSCQTCGMTGIVPTHGTRNYGLCPQCNAEYEAADAGGYTLCSVKHCLNHVKGTDLAVWPHDKSSEESEFCPEHYSLLIGKDLV